MDVPRITLVVLRVLAIPLAVMITVVSQDAYVVPLRAQDVVNVSVAPVIDDEVVATYVVLSSVIANVYLSIV